MTEDAFERNGRKPCVTRFREPGLCWSHWNTLPEPMNMRHLRHLLTGSLALLLVACAAQQAGAPVHQGPTGDSAEAPASDHEAGAGSLALPQVSTLPNGIHLAHHAPESCPLCGIYDHARESTFVVVANGGLGTAVLVAAGGLAVTNAHVVQNAKEVKVARYDGTRETAQVVMVDVKEDLALLKIENISESTALAEFRLEPPRVGSEVYAVGHPLGLGWTISRGIVSGLPMLGDRPMVQTDTPISPGNSGGPLLGTQGHIVGIVTEKLNGGGAENIAFARPSMVVVSFLERAGVAVDRG